MTETTRNAPMPGPGAGTLVNGLAADRISVLDRAVQYGDGLFETLAVHAGRPLLWERHMERLRGGCLHLGLDMPEDRVLRAEVDSLCHGGERAVIKIILTRGCSGRGYAPPDAPLPTRVVSAWPWPDYPAYNARLGVAVRWCRTPVSINLALAGIKHLNRLEQVLARAEWGGEFAEGLMRDPDGYVVEGTMSNVFAVTAGVLITPELSRSGVAGVMRAEVMAAARHLGMRCEERWITASELEKMDEIFLTNSIIGLWPVRSLADKCYAVGAVTKTLQWVVREALGLETESHPIA